jgi:hypothetical protein
MAQEQNYQFINLNNSNSMEIEDVSNAAKVENDGSLVSASA